MEKYLNVSNSKTAAIYLLIMVSLLISGCTAVGRVISVENRIMFSDTQSDQGTYSYGGLTVEYRYKLTGGNMTLDGKAHYRGGVDSLDVRLLFLDAEGRVLQQKIVYSSGYRVSRSRADRIFKDTLAVPPGAASISFSYSSQPRSSHK